MRVRSRAFSLAAALVLTAASARAEIDARRVTTLATRATAAGRPFALADERGKLPLLVRVPDGVPPEARALLPLAPGLGALHLAPEDLERYLAQYPDVRAGVAPPRRPLVEVSPLWTKVLAFREETGLDGTGVVIGIIDTGLDVTHPDFRDAAGKSRVAWMMVREPPRGLHPELEAAYGCQVESQSPCAILSGADIDALVAESPDAAPRDLVGHGTHVTSIAAGNGGPSVTRDPHYVGMAPGATIIVAAPTAAGGFSDPDILKAARFVFDRADELGRPAVLNVSLGSDFGPHDGTSELEKGLASMVGEGKKGRAMVAAAGNSGALYELDGQGPLGIHTEVHVSPHALGRVPMTVPGANRTVDGAGFVWITFRPGDEVAVGLEGPDGEGWLGLIDPGDEAGFEEDDVSGAVVNNVPGPRANITADTNSAVVVWDGRWRGDAEVAVLLRGRGDAQLWVTGTGQAAPGATVGLSFLRATRAGTIAVPASAPGILAVGCTLNRVDWHPFGAPPLESVKLASFGGEDNPLPDSTCYFSAAGPTPNGVMKPDLLAPGGLVAGAMSRDADPRTHEDSIFNAPGCPEDPSRPPCHMVDERHALTSGTSMSAPHVAGAIALLLERDPTLTQPVLMDVLQAGVARPTGRVPFDYQQGPGELDVLGALAALDQRDLAVPSADKSWFALGSPYVRPDPGWPVAGVVELRSESGAVAVGGSADLDLVVDGGLVLEPLTRVRAGMWRFAFSAPHGSGGTSVTVDVRWRGRSLGARSLPIAIDAWVATGGMEAVGGCALGRGPPPSPAGALAWLVLFIVAFRRSLTSERAPGSRR